MLITIIYPVAENNSPDAPKLRSTHPLLSPFGADGARSELARVFFDQLKLARKASQVK